MNGALEIFYHAAQHAADEASYRRDGRLLVIAMVGTMMLLPAMLLGATYGEDLATQAFATVVVTTFVALAVAYATPRPNREEQDRLREALDACRTLPASLMTQLAGLIAQRTAADIVVLLHDEFQPRPVRNAIAAR